MRQMSGERVRGRTSPVATMKSRPHRTAVVVTWFWGVGPASNHVFVIV